MFFCLPCQTKNNWPESMFRSHGHCELCGATNVECFEIQSSQLPPVREAIKEPERGQ